jgi:2-iminoacetate synthase
MSSFYNIYEKMDFHKITEAIFLKTAADVENALAGVSSLQDRLYALLSPAASAYIEEMAQEAHRITLERFGRTMQIYAPLYLSNECANSCLYCGFSGKNKDLVRRTLNAAEIKAELEAIRSMGIRHILLVSGEAPAKVDLAYLAESVRLASKGASAVGIEVYPLSEAGYAELVQVGADSLTLYQETYCKERYSELHPGGKKADIAWRLDAPDRGAAAGMRTVGVGPLLGLSEPRTDVFYALTHAAYLMDNYWRSAVTVSFPRLRAAEGCVVEPIEADDRMLVQFITAARIVLPDVGITLSTREKALLRNRLVPLGLTQMSAASVTEPGGYTEKNLSGCQFNVEDGRSVSEFCAMLSAQGYEAVMKDWDVAL